MLRCYEPAHIVGVSKTAYVPATPRCLEWRRDLQPTSTNSAPPDPDSQDPCRRPARRPRGDRRSPRPPVAGVLALDGVRITPSRTVPRGAPWRARRGRRCRPRRHDGLRRRAFRVSPSSTPICSVPCARLRRMPRGRVPRRQRLALPRLPGAPPPMRRSRSTARKRKPPAGWPPPTRLLTSRGTRSTSGPPEPRRGCPRTAPRTGCAGSTATSPGTTNCARRPSLTAALPCTPTRPTIQGCSSEERRSGRWPPSRMVALISAGCGSDAPSETGTDRHRHRQRRTPRSSPLGTRR